MNDQVVRRRPMGRDFRCNPKGYPYRLSACQNASQNAKNNANRPSTTGHFRVFFLVIFPAADHAWKPLPLRRWPDGRVPPESPGRQTQLPLAGRRPSPDFAREFFTLTAKGRSSMAIWRSNQYSA